MDTTISTNTPVILRKLHAEIHQLSIQSFLGLIQIGDIIYIVLSEAPSIEIIEAIEGVIAVHDVSSDHEDSYYEALYG